MTRRRRIVRPLAMTRAQDVASKRRFAFDEELALDARGRCRALLVLATVLFASRHVARGHSVWVGEDEVEVEL
jgi:hypothetical protein